MKAIITHTATAAHIEVGGTPWCEWTGCMAGLDVATKTGVHQCQFPSISKATAAAKSLRPHFKRGRVKVVRGSCPADITAETP